MITIGNSEMQKINNRGAIGFTDDYTTERMIVENEMHAEHLAVKKHLAELKEQIAANEEQIAANEEQIAARNAAIMAKEQELAQRKKLLEEKYKQLEEKTKQVAEKKALLSTALKMLASAGIPNEQIAQKLNISVEMVEALMEN
jgi:predicted  nucleic acid-binding Zn-ribbon protein